MNYMKTIREDSFAKMKIIARESAVLRYSMSVYFRESEN